MWTWIKKLNERWDGWISDSDLERALRAHLTGKGYYGDTARFRNFRLVGIQRPGWLQVFCFSVHARVAKSDPDHPDSAQLFGIVRQDERYRRCEIEIFRNAVERNFMYHLWTEDLIRLRRPSL